jgi:hypothetical protein
MVAILTNLFGVENLDLAEDVVQETLIKALRLWPYQGITNNPGGWLIQVAKNQALDALRRDGRWRHRAALLVEGSLGEAEIEGQPLDPLGDEQLAMVFICCHSALPRRAQIALTLKTVGGCCIGDCSQVSGPGADHCAAAGSRPAASPRGTGPFAARRFQGFWATGCRVMCFICCSVKAGASRMPDPARPLRRGDTAGRAVS